MRTLVHLSDLHFGRVQPATVEPLVAAVWQIAPDLAAVSGDLTQRARRREFEEARRFLDRLPSPQIVVPGNHDVPLYDVWRRFLAPLGRFRRFVTSELEPYFGDAEIAVVGINTARSWTFQGGRINEEQVERLGGRLCRVGDGVTKIVVTHHPFDIPEGYAETDLVGRAQMAMRTLARCGADVLLAGHLHVSHTGHTATRYRLEGHSALVVQAGTATSTRERGERNSFNVLRIARPRVSVERWVFDGSAFRPEAVEHFERRAAGWERISPKKPVEQAAEGKPASRASAEGPS